MSSPCIDICEINSSNNRCKGCWRTVEQIEQWIEYTEEEQLRIMKELEIAQWELGDIR